MMRSNHGFQRQQAGGGVEDGLLCALLTPAPAVLRAPRMASRVIADWFGWYNHQRPHQALKMKTPAEAYALAN